MADVHATVAIVDDEEAVRRALGRLLRALQMEVSVYASGEEFLHSLRTARPDCVVLDFQMPGLTGRDVQRAIAMARLHVPVIMVTAHDHPALREQCLAEGAIAWLPKPLRRDNLLAAIELALREPIVH